LKSIIVILCALYSATSAAEIYRWTDSNNKVHFGDRKPNGEKAEPVQVRVNSYTNVTYQLAPRTTAIVATKIQKDVVMYSTVWCGYCKQARAYFAQNNIPYTDYDVEQSAEAKQNYDAIGGRGVPVIFIGQSRMNGFSAASFEYLYKQ
jgi:glutaredoxin